MPNPAVSAAVPAAPSFVDAGLTQRILLRKGLAYSAPKRVLLRAILAVAIAWIPLLMLSLREGSQSLSLFLYDFEIQIRLLVALPAAILAEIFVDRWSSQAVIHFRVSGLVGPEAEAGWSDALRDFRRILDSIWTEVALLAIVVLLTWRGVVVGPIAELHPWQFQADGALSAAGWWHRIVSRPLYAFIMLSWLLKLVIWTRLLYRASKLDLSLQPAHPDRAGGLGFVGLTHGAFAPLMFAIMAASGGTLVDLVRAGMLELTTLKWLLVALLILVLLIFIGPLFVFVPRLIALKREGQFEYGALAARYAREFDSKWIRGRAAADESLIGSADIQSMADMGGTLEPVVGMRILPIDFATIRLLAIAAALPLFPVLCVVVPVNEMVKRVLGLLL